VGVYYYRDDHELPCLLMSRPDEPRPDVIDTILDGVRANHVPYRLETYNGQPARLRLAAFGPPFLREMIIRPSTTVYIIRLFVAVTKTKPKTAMFGVELRANWRFLPDFNSIDDATTAEALEFHANYQRENADRRERDRRKRDRGEEEEEGESKKAKE